MNNQTNWPRELLEAALLGVAVFIAIQLAVANFRVEGSSMRPTLLPDQYLVVSKMVYHRIDTGRLGQIIPFWQPREPRAIHLDLHLDTGRLGQIIPFWQPREPRALHAVRPPRRGDVIVFNYPLEPERQFVKRIIAEPGDHIAIAGGQVSVNGQPLDEPYLTLPGAGDMHPVQLADGEYFVLGDNRPGSRDSRHWGPLPANQIIGKVWAIYWPRSAWGLPQ